MDILRRAGSFGSQQEPLDVRQKTLTETIYNERFGPIKILSEEAKTCLVGCE